MTKPETVQKEEKGEFLSTQDIKEVARTAESRGATKVMKVNQIGARKQETRKKEKKEEKEQVSRL